MTGSFGGEERFEDAVLGLAVHAGAGIGNGQQYIAARFHHRMLLLFAFAHLGIAGLKDELAALGHGIARVDRQIHHHLFDLAGIGFHRP